MTTALPRLSRLTRLLAGCSALLTLLLLATAPGQAQSPTWQWGLQSTNITPADGTAAIGNAVATDAAGRVYVGGAAGDSPSSAPVTRRFGTAGLVGHLRSGFVAQATPAGQWAWVTVLNPTGSGGTRRVSVTGVAVTATGDVYATGRVADAQGIQGGTVTQTLGSSGQAVFVARFSSAGECQWIRVAEASVYAPPTLAADPATGGVVVAGSYQGPLSFGSYVLPAHSSTNSGAIYVARLSSTGQWLSAAASSGPAGLISGVQLAVGSLGQVAVASSQEAGTLTFGTSALTVPAGADESFAVAQLSPANQWQWAVGGRGSSISSVLGVAYTSTGALWVSGRGIEGTEVGPLTLVTPNPMGTRTNYAGFMGQLSAAGQWGTVRQFAPSNDGLAVFGALTADAAGNAVGWGALWGYNGAVQAQLGSHTLSAPANGILLFVTSLSSTGQWQYAAPLPQPAIPRGLTPAGIALDGRGNLYLTGGLRGSLTLGSSMLSGSDDGSPTSGTGDVVLAQLSNATALASRAAAGTASLAAFPNPAAMGATVTLRLPGPASTPLVVVLQDALGRRTRQITIPAGARQATVPATGLAPGLYLLEAGTSRTRLVIE